MTRPKVDMSFETLTCILAQIDARFLEMVVLHSDGEPLLNADITRFVAELKKHNVTTWTSTNATLLDEEKARALVESGLDVLTISIDGTTPEVYHAIRRGADFDTVMRNVRRFLEIKGKRPPLVVPQMIVMAENEHQQQSFLEMWKPYKKLGVYPLLKPKVDWFKARPAALARTDCCDRPWFGMVILSNGDVVSCVHDFNASYVLGNVKNHGLMELWNGDKSVALRDHLKTDRSKSPLCKDCNYTPPRKHTFVSDSALTILDMGTITKLLPRFGYTRKSQY